MEFSLDILALLLLYILFFFRKWKIQGKDILFVNTLLYVYIACVLFFTLMPVIPAFPFIFDHPYTPMNMIPFIDVINSYGDFVRQIILNVIMLVPFGFLLPLTRRKPGFFKVFLLTFLLSLVIELLQPLLHGSRSSDITDLITNTCGGILGYLLSLMFNPISTRLLARIKT